MHGAEEPRFARLRRLMEDEWVPEMRVLLGIGERELPLVWDADFLFGPPQRSRGTRLSFAKSTSAV